MAVKIAIANQKGGVGKTTTAINLADALKHCNYKVLFVDLDPQNNSTSTYQAKVDNEYTIYDVLKGECETKDAIQTTVFGDILVGDPQLTTLEFQLLQRPNGFMAVKKALKSVEENYDYIIMDTPPNLGIFMGNALTAANGIIIPVLAEKYAVDGLGKLIETFNDVLESTNSELKIYGVLLTAYDARTKLGRETKRQLPEIGEEFGFHVFETPVRICQNIRDAQTEQVSLFERYGNCNGAVDYANVVKELLEEV